MLMLRARSFRMPGPVPADQQVPLMQTSGLSVGMPSSRDSADTKLVLRGLACSPLHSVSFSISGPPASDRSVARPAHAAGADESGLPFQTDWIGSSAAVAMAVQHSRRPGLPVMISDYGRVLARDLHSGHQESAKKRARGYS